MKRRTFLGAGAAAALAWAAPCASPTSAAVARTTWQLTGPHCRYVLRLEGPAFTCDCYPHRSEDAAVSPAADDAAAMEDAALLVAGPELRPVEWRVADWLQPDEWTLNLSLAAVALPLQANLAFAIDVATGFLLRRTQIHHRGTGPDVVLAAPSSLCCRIHEAIEGVCHLSGAWAHETQVRRGDCDQPLVMESRVGKTGFAFQPYVALSTKTATYLCQLLWSGNWLLSVTPGRDSTVLRGGLSNWQFRHRLSRNDRLDLPDALFGRFDGDLNDATQRLHDYRRARRPNADRHIPVQFNSWYPYLGEPTADVLLPLVPVVKHLGCEAFVVDAGWYETDAGESAGDWAARTGDWRASRLRFPKGLEQISAACHERNLLFGLWFEPEVIGPLSSIRAAHPEWLHHIGGGPPRPDERAVLHLGIPSAREWVFERIADVLSSAKVDWMKWDFNTDLGAGGWASGLPSSLTRQDPLVAHYAGLYALQHQVRRRFPNLILEMCASGGGRMDGKLLSGAHLNWISDQPGALRKLAIHFGSQLAHPAVACNDWLVEWPRGSIAGYDDLEPGGTDDRGDLAFRLRVAMLGSFGISARIDRWSPADLATAAEHIALYRETIRPIIHDGDQYLLTGAPPLDGNGDWAAIWYAAKDGLSGVLFTFRLASDEASRCFELPGLDADRRYRARSVSGAALETTGKVLSDGLIVALPRHFQSELTLVELM